MDVGRGGVRGRGEPCGGGGPACAGGGGRGAPPRRGDATACGAQPVEDVVQLELGVGHAPSARNRAAFGGANSSMTTSSELTVVIIRRRRRAARWRGRSGTGRR